VGAAGDAMAGRVCAITGASSGLGYETALALARQGATVALLCRSVERGTVARERIAAATGHEDLHVVHCDMANLDTVHAAAGELLARFDALHVLVNNAGLMLMQRRITVDGLEETFQVNHLGAFLLTDRLRERLVASAPARVVTVSSFGHRGTAIDFRDLQSERFYEGFAAYCRSKLANVMFTYELARRLEGTGVTANTLHPGFARTGFGRGSGAVMRVLLMLAQTPPLGVSARRGARTQVWLAGAAAAEGVSGRYFHGQRARRSSRISYDQAAQRRLWEASEALLSRSGDAPGSDV
jgi:NAD(P)-dependent dehydrogenase (short-subunit alcohol dehydrogenase family)